MPNLITSRAIIGRFYETLEAGDAAWVNAISFAVDSDQASETYAWLGATPRMREWIGGRQAVGLSESSFEIRNRPYETTLDILVADLRRDKSSQIMTRVDELADEANLHIGTLMSTLLINGESAVCYDGQYFFDTDHAEGASGTQSNLLSIDISALPVSTHGTTTAPSAAEVSYMIAQSIQAILGFKDDRGRPMNQGARAFQVQCPVSWMSAASMALSGKPLEQGDTSVIGTLPGFTIDLVVNPELTWTNKIATLRTDGRVKPFIKQEEVPITMSAIAEGSQMEFTDRKHQYGVEWEGACGYGRWQHAVLAAAA